METPETEKMSKMGKGEPTPEDLSRVLKDLGVTDSETIQKLNEIFEGDSSPSQKLNALFRALSPDQQKNGYSVLRSFFGKFQGVDVEFYGIGGGDNYLNHSTYLHKTGEVKSILQKIRQQVDDAKTKKKEKPYIDPVNQYLLDLEDAGQLDSLLELAEKNFKPEYPRATLYVLSPLVRSKGEHGRLAQHQHILAK